MRACVRVRVCVRVCACVGDYHVVKVEALIWQFCGRLRRRHPHILRFHSLNNLRACLGAVSFVDSATAASGYVFQEVSLILPHAVI